MIDVIFENYGNAMRIFVI